MSHPNPSTSSSPNFQLVFNNALDAYKKRTKNDLLAHPLVAQLQDCNSHSAILAVIHRQFQQFQQFREGDERFTKWLDPTVKVLYSLSETLGEGVSLVFSPAKVIFAGVGVFLSTAMDVRASQETLIDIFDRMENFFQRLGIYTNVSPTPEMVDMIVKIMVEVLSVLAIATKEMKQGRTRKYLKRLIGRTDIEDALKRLEKLANEEVRMVAAQGLNVIQQVADDMDQVKRNQLRQDLRKWLSPPDPSINHNIACAAHLKQTADWFFQGTIFTEWKSNGSLLWLHGKPGSGKSILCSTIIQDVVTLRGNRLASMAYFYFDFRDINKQNRRDLLPSLLTQLSNQSHRHCDILNGLYLKHESGAQKPSEDELIECLKDMVTLPDQQPVYLIIDALDECPDTSGLPSPREQVLDLFNTLVELSSPNLRLCVTSRPEIDIRRTLEPLTSLRVSLHEQSGQRQDIIEYVTSVVQSDPKMHRWRDEDKNLVIETLCEKADGMFRYAFCQLEALRHCLAPRVRHMLKELPKTLDETYERILRDINKANWDHAHQLLQCLTVAVRPLRVAELAEVLAVDFGTASRGETSKLNTDWRWEDEQEAVLSTCSSLISVVDEKGSQVVQFSHFSVKEFLMSSRIADSSADVLAFHIVLEPAHTVLAKACLGVLLRLGERVDEDSFEDSFEESVEGSVEDSIE